ncbi:uncharacterized protein LOC143190505 [Rhynchophorus ferrugineus]|uniref:CYTH domain-containing protein n=1 Tax=Rhynchophorus ferrugineus TaxID=354439 RepID=A0A834MGM6_RHYFE|nr:hypothetical protein GWI33_001041 [Rhynchophorus ferrugineus]
MRNVEIKAKINDIQLLLLRVKELFGTTETLIKQHDTFYNVTKGRLKLRRLLDVGDGELIFYDRPDVEGPKLSSYKKADIKSNEVSVLNDVLIEALGAKNDVKKLRHLFLVGQTRVHIDEVENLGNFLELEVCLKPEQTLEDGEVIANDIMNKLGIKKEDLIQGAYADLLNA